MCIIAHVLHIKSYGSLYFKIYCSKFEYTQMEVAHKHNKKIERENSDRLSTWFLRKHHFLELELSTYAVARVKKKKI